MKKGKKLIVPGIYFLIVGATVLSITFMTKKINETAIADDYDYSKSLIKEVTQVVYGEVEDTEESFIKPVVSENASLNIHYYEKDAEDLLQQESLIFYENTYMPSSGIVYESNEDFDVIAIYDGTVSSIKNDEILGSYITINHGNDMQTSYYSLKDIKLNEGDEVKQGTILGKATNNKIYDNNSLFFEVYLNGKLVNPEKIFEQKPSDLLK